MSALYTNYKRQCISASEASHGDVDLKVDTIKCALVTSSTYTFSAAHEDLAELTVYVGTTDQTLTPGNITTIGGVFDHSTNLTFTAVAIDTARDVDELVHYYSTGSAATSPLICYHNAFANVTPNGGDITVAYNGSGIFSI